ncbi:MAG TPA: HAMP domain-containing sensor histidine kinase [Candidatus Baltobacteraceae bacterium]
MSTDAPFVAFARRLTRGYVVLAVILIAVVVGATSTIAFVGYAGNLNDAVAVAADRATQRAAVLEKQGLPLSKIAPQLTTNERRSRIGVSVFDDAHHRLAGRQTPPSRVAAAIAALLGIHSKAIRITGGVVFVSPDLDSFTDLLGRYWAYILPIGLIAVLIAWLVGWRITRSAIAPLVDVTQALNTIAAGDFTPKPVLERDSELRALTAAYNDVAFRLSAATAEQLRQESEMRQFIADAGHELRTPLTIFMGYLEALRDGVVRDEPGIARVHETMLAQSRRMRTIIEKLILLARLERETEPRRDRVDLASIAARAVAALRPLAGDRIALSGSGATQALGDDAELYEALKNVIENAVRYAPDSPVEVEVRGDVDGVRVAVADRGPGMEPVDIEHAFDRFYRGSERGAIEGSGLGLAIAKRAVERAGGTITVQSTRGSGTRIEMQFPTDPNQAALST